MAERPLIAFGRYLRTLRERRRLSLDDVASLTKLYPEPVGKSYLSRCENGISRIALSKTIALSRVYEVPLEVIGERLTLDLELSKMKPPRTQGMGFEELVNAGAASVKRGEFWNGYAYFRDAYQQAASAPLMTGFRDIPEQVGCIGMNVSTMAGKLGKELFALHEIEYLRSEGCLGPLYYPVLLERLACQYRSNGNLEKAKELADQAIVEAENHGSKSYLGYMLASRAKIADFENDTDSAINFYQMAYDVFCETERHPERANTMLNLAQLYFDAGRLVSAKRALVSAEKLAVPVREDWVRSRARILLGKIEESEGKSKAAIEHWREAIHIAKKLGDRAVVFRAEYQLYEYAIRSGDVATAESLGRRLSKLSSMLPEELREVKEFRAQAKRLGSESAKSVSVRKQNGTLRRNEKRPA